MRLNLILLAMLVAIGALFVCLESFGLFLDIGMAIMLAVAATAVVGSLLAFWCVFGGRYIASRYASLAILAAGLVLLSHFYDFRFAVYAILFPLFVCSVPLLAARKLSVSLQRVHDTRLGTKPVAISRILKRIYSLYCRIFVYLPSIRIELASLIVISFVLCFLVIVVPTEARSILFSRESIFAGTALATGLVILPLVWAVLAGGAVLLRFAVFISAIAAATVFLYVCGSPWSLAATFALTLAIGWLLVGTVLRVDGYLLIKSAQGASS